MNGFGDVSGMEVLFVVLFFVSIAFIAAMGWKAYRRIFHPEDAQQQIVAEPKSMQELMVQRKDHPEGLQLGYFEGENGEDVPVTILPAERDTHLYICGTSGMGKSKGIKYMMIQDIMEGRGLGLVDIHGDLVDEITPWAIGMRQDDTILFDPTDLENIPGFNPLEPLPGLNWRSRWDSLTTPCELSSRTPGECALRIWWPVHLGR